MSTVVIQGLQDICIPAWLVDLASFQRWTESDKFPEHGRIDYLKGEVWVDRGDEQVFSHNQGKTEYTSTLHLLSKKERLGRFLQDGVRMTHPAMDISSIPDGMFIT